MFIWAPVSRRTIRVCPTDTVKPPDAALEANLQADFQTLRWNLASIPEYAGGLRSMRNHGMTSGTFGANIGASCQSMMMTDLPSSNSGQSDFMELAAVRAWKPGTSHLGIRTCSNRSDSDDPGETSRTWLPSSTMDLQSSDCVVPERSVPKLRAEHQRMFNRQPPEHHLPWP